jgi:hypothetical protein
MSFLDDIVNAWIPTRSGRQFNPFDPDIEDICIEDIARGLSQQCRWNGQTEWFLSVAQHSIMVSQLLEQRGAPPLLQMCGLLHDAAEGLGLPDLPAPIKRVMPAYSALEDSVLQMVAMKFGLPWPFPLDVREADVDLRTLEVRDACSLAMRVAMPVFPEVDTPLRLNPRAPGDVERAFLFRYEALGMARQMGLRAVPQQAMEDVCPGAACECATSQAVVS